MGDKVPANKAALMRELRGGRENQGLGQKPVSGAEHTPRTRGLWLEIYETYLSPCGRHDSLLLVGWEPLTPKVSCSSSGTDPKGLTHLLQKLWRHCSGLLLL